MFLLDEEQLKVIDMSSTTSYEFTMTSHSSFRIFYGRDIQNSVSTRDVKASTPYPNPLNNESVATINLALPDNAGEYQVNLQIYNSQGIMIDSFSKSFSSGVHPLEFALSNANLASGIYIYRLAIGSEKSSHIYAGKIAKP